MTQQVDIGPSALKLHDGVFNSDHFYLNARNIDHDLSFDDLKLNDFIIKTHENDISQLNKERKSTFLASKIDNHDDRSNSTKYIQFVFYIICLEFDISI